MTNLIIDTYQTFVRKLCKDSSYTYKGDTRDNACIDNFIKLVDKAYGIESLGKVFIYDYFCFQLNYWMNLETRFGKKIPITWFIGKKAFQRWQDNPNTDLYHAHKSAESFGINSETSDRTKEKLDVLAIKKHEEAEKIRFKDPAAQLLHCMNATTLFNHRSPNCISCSSKAQCKIILERDFYRIYIKRGYNEKNSIKAG